MKKEVKAAIAAEKGKTPTNKTIGNGDGTGTGTGTGKTGLTLDDIEINMPLGRPVNPDSERQKRLAKYAEKAATQGTLKRGRPSNPESANAKKQAEREARILALKEAALAKMKAEGTIPAGNDVHVVITADQAKEIETEMEVAGHVEAEVVK